MADEVRAVPPESWAQAVQEAREEGFGFFDVLTAVDLEADGVEVVCRLWDVAGRRGLLLSCRVPREDPRLPTLTHLYGGADWHERATAEMLGVVFEGHETQRLLLPERFEGHPLRKDVVLAARVAKAWPGTKEPGESDADLARPRRRPSPPGRPAGWGE